MSGEGSCQVWIRVIWSRALGEVGSHLQGVIWTEDLRGKLETSSYYRDKKSRFHQHKGRPRCIQMFIKHKYRLREVGILTKFLGSNIQKWSYVHENGLTRYYWVLGSETYVKKACIIAESQMKSHNLQYPSLRRHRYNTPFSSLLYRPELDASLFFSPQLTSLYQNMLGVLRWIVVLGRIDIQHETSLLSQYLVQPREGHLSQACNIFRYLKTRHSKGCIVMNKGMCCLQDDVSISRKGG